MQRFLLFLFIAAFCFASNYVTNGDFEQPLTTGWTQYTSSSYGFIGRSTGYHPDPDYEAQVRRQGSAGLGGGYDRLYQTVNITIPLEYIDFTASVKLDAYDSGTPWAGAGCCLYYLNQSNVVLGVTRICRYSAGHPWTNTPTQHLIIASDTLWHNYSFNVGDELDNLPGVDPDAVAKIRVALMDTCYNC